MLVDVVARLKKRRVTYLCLFSWQSQSDCIQSTSDHDKSGHHKSGGGNDSNANEKGKGDMGDGASDTGESVTESSNDGGIEGSEIEGSGIEGGDGTIDRGDCGNRSDRSDHSNRDYKAVHNFIVPAHALRSIGHDSGLQNKQVVSDSEKEERSYSRSKGDEGNEEVIHTRNLHASLHENDILQHNKVVSDGGIDGDGNTISQVSPGQEAHVLGEPDLFGASRVTG